MLRCSRPALRSRTVLAQREGETLSTYTDVLARLHSDETHIASFLAAALADHGHVDPDGHARIEAASGAVAKAPGDTLLELGVVTATELADFYASWLAIPRLTAADFAGASAVPDAPGTDYCERAGVQVLERDGRILLGMVDPLAGDVLEAVGYRMGCTPEPAVLTRRDIEEIGSRHQQEAATASVSTTDADAAVLRALAEDGPVVQLVNAILADAVQDGASDIHFESLDDQFRVRFRIDGRLEIRRCLAVEQGFPVISRLKVIADLNIAERRRPQDGRIATRVRGRDIDLRLSTLPTQHGESAVIRILDRSALKLDWDALGFRADMAQAIMQATGRPDGLFLVTGPTGSGKTTTLYTVLDGLNRTDRKLFTIEDPIEYALAGVNQIQINADIGFGFADAIRSILRQDPDIVMVGEIRDSETAANAIRAALTGRMVLSTVHTNSTVAAVDRLTDLGVPPYLLASTLRGVLAQRLVRRVCQSCSGTGCAVCHNTGLKGRLAVAELLDVNAELAEAIVENRRSSALSAIMERQGQRLMAEDARDKIEAGLTTRNEVGQVIGLAR